MKIAVRMDDITPDMNWENFNFFVELFKEAQITPLLGIVPDNRDENLKREMPREDFYERMRALQEQGYVLALHGCHHSYTSAKGGLFPLNHFSEFAGVPYEQQKELLENGIDILKEHGIVTDIFMAPAHSYDKYTLRALKELGITRMTDGFGMAPYRDWGMDFYPISFHMGRSLKKEKGMTTLVIHANTVHEAEKERYRKLFKEYRESFISYGEYLKCPVKKRKLPARYLEYLLAESKRLLVKIRG